MRGRRKGKGGSRGVNPLNMNDWKVKGGRGKVGSPLQSPLTYLALQMAGPMIGENRQLVTYEPVGFEK